MATSKEPIGYKLTGKKITLVIDGETFQKVVEDTEERKLLKTRVMAYNAKPLVKEKAAIKKLIREDKVKAQKEKASAVKKESIIKLNKKAKEVIEKEPELTQEQQIEAAKKLLSDNGFTVNAKSTPTTYKRRGEY